MDKGQGTARKTRRDPDGLSWERPSPEDFARLAEHLAGPGQEALRSLPSQDLLAAWQETVAAFRDPESAERKPLDPVLARSCRLSTEGLSAGLEAVLGGVCGAPAEELFAQAEARRAHGSSDGLVLVLLASNLPALAVQPLLPALALRRPVILKSPTAEPDFAPAFVDALARREPAVGEAVSALTWRGGEQELEAPLLEAAAKVLAYGEAETLADLERRAPGKVVGFGPKTSLAVVGDGVMPADLAPGLARDVALFDQRGCLSVAALYVEGGEPRARAWAEPLARALAELAERWPPGPADSAAAAAVQQVRGEAMMRGLGLWTMGDLAEGTVLVEPEPAFRPTPGLRTVRVHPLEGLRELPEILEPWRGRLQGVARAGEGARKLEPAWAELGVSRVAAPGLLQSPDALWHNGGRHPLDLL